MPKYILAYHRFAKFENLEAGATAMKNWLGDMGEKCVDWGNPVGLSKTVSADGIADNGGANPLSGYSIIEAGDDAEACEMAKACPILSDGKGSVEVAPIMEM